MFITKRKHDEICQALQEKLDDEADRAGYWQQQADHYAMMYYEEVAEGYTMQKDGDLWIIKHQYVRDSSVRGIGLETVAITAYKYKKDAQAKLNELKRDAS